MEIKDPELRASVDHFLQQEYEGLDPTLKKIVALMDAFGGPFRFKLCEPMPEDKKWRPTAPVYKEIVANLIAPENREALRKWYSDSRHMEMNPTAEALRDALSDMIGEELK